MKVSLPHLTTRPMLRMMQGALAGSGAPLGWAIIQALRGLDIRADILQNPILYLYLLFGTVIVFAIFGRYVGLQESKMQQLSWRDPLTGLYNVRYFRERLGEQMAAVQRDGPMSLVYFDLDHFKRVNDTHGHAAGDIVLIKLTQHIHRILRQSELFARIGGEEFAVLVPHSAAGHVVQLANRILEAARTLVIRLDDGTDLTVTLSIGVAEQRADDTLNTFSERADTAMYSAKRTGRNRVVVAS